MELVETDILQTTEIYPQRIFINKTNSDCGLKFHGSKGAR